MRSTGDWTTWLEISSFKTRWFRTTFVKYFKISDNTYDDKTDRGFKVRPVIDHVNKNFAEVLSNNNWSNVWTYVMFKGRSAMKQYTKSKPIKWGFKFWFTCSSKTEYLFQMDIYLGKKQNKEFNLDEEVILQLTKDLKGLFVLHILVTFSTAPSWLKNCLSRTFMLSEPFPKTDSKCQKCLMIRKWTGVTASFCIQKIWWPVNGWIIGMFYLYLLHLKAWMMSVQRREKGSATKSSNPCPTVVKLYNNGMGQVDLMDQRTETCRLDRKSSVRFYLHSFFDLLGIACVNSFLVYNMKHPTTGLQNRLQHCWTTKSS